MWLCSLSSYYEKVEATGEVKCIDEEIPFEIPQGWEWCRIRNISQSYIGLTYSPSDVSSQGTIVLRSSNIQDGRIVFDDIVRVTKNISEKLLVEKNDIIICARNGSAKLVGKSAIVTEITEPMTFGAFMAICKTSLYQYVSIFLQSNLFFSQLRGVSGTTTINQLTQSNFNNFLIAIPPLEEQHRIFEKVNDVLPIVEIYGNKQEQLNRLNDNLRENVKKSILQEAIQGKLVSQIAKEGTAQDLLEAIKEEKQKLVKEGKLKKSALNDSIIFKGDDNRHYEKIGKTVQCIEDEIPFEIPESWAWVRLSYVAEIARGGSPRPIKEYQTDSVDGINWIKIGDTEKDGKYINSAKEKITKDGVSKSRMVYKGDFLLTNSMSFGRPYITNINGCVHDGWLVISPISNSFDQDFLYHLLSSGYAYKQFAGKASGAVVQNLNRDKVASALFPIPPYTEQQRIVAQIEKLFEHLR